MLPHSTLLTKLLLTEKSWLHFIHVMGTWLTTSVRCSCSSVWLDILCVLKIRNENKKLPIVEEYGSSKRTATRGASVCVRAISRIHKLSTPTQTRAHVKHVNWVNEVLYVFVQCSHWQTTKIECEEKWRKEQHRNIFSYTHLRFPNLNINSNRSSYARTKELQFKIYASVWIDGQRRCGGEVNRTEAFRICTKYDRIE